MGGLLPLKLYNQALPEKPQGNLLNTVFDWQYRGYLDLRISKSGSKSFEKGSYNACLALDLEFITFYVFKFLLFSSFQIQHFISDVPRFNITTKKSFLFEYSYLFFSNLVLCIEATHILHLTVTLMMFWFIERFIFSHINTTQWFWFCHHRKK